MVISKGVSGFKNKPANQHHLTPSTPQLELSSDTIFAFFRLNTAS